MLDLVSRHPDFYDHRWSGSTDAGGPMPSAPSPAERSEADVPTSVGPARIAVIAFQVTVTSTNEFQRAFLDVQKKFTPKRKLLKTMSDQIDSLTKECRPLIAS